MRKNLLRIIGVLMTVCLLSLPVSCGSPEPGTGLQDSDNPPSSSLAERSVWNQNDAVISLDRFEAEINKEKLGVLNRVDGKDGYDAALVTAEDGTNYIYMYLPDEKMAKSILTDTDGDHVTDTDLTLTLKKNGYELYTQETEGTGSSDDAMYGRCLLAGSMILIVNGTQDRKIQIKENADRFMNSLGFELK